MTLARDDGHVRLRVSDSGVGFEKANHSPTLGMQLVGILAKQLGGSVEFRSSAGTTVELEFPSEAKTR